MSQLNIRPVSIVKILCVTLMLTTNAGAQPSFRDNIVQAQELVRGGTRQILEDELMLGEEEQATFWPLYDKYEVDRSQVAEKYIDLVSEFVDRYQRGELTDDDADRLLEAYLEIEMDSLTVRERYVGRFQEILPGIIVMRLFQLENKVKAEVDAALALAIPLADPR